MDVVRQLNSPISQAKTSDHTVTCSNKFILVAQVGLHWNSIYSEIMRWKQLSGMATVAVQIRGWD